MRVFVSYSQDSDAHSARVLALAQALRAEGIDARIDLFEPAPPQGWPAWMREQVIAADRIVCVCTAAYKSRFEDGTTRISAGGVPWEGSLIEGRIHREGGGAVVPILFSDGGSDDVPAALANLTRISLTPPDVTPLVTRLLDHDRVTPAPLGAAPLRSAGASPEAWLPTLAEVAAGHEFRSGELRYRLVERVASGEFGQVWRAVQLTRRGDGRTVAVKVMHPHLFDRKDRRDRFRRGAQAMLDLDHPGIVRVHSHRIEGGPLLWFAMDWYGRGDLARAVEAGMPAEDAVEAVLGIADALTALHAIGLVHRDVKPRNILLGDDGRSRLTDFDLVRDLEHSRTGATRVMGSLLFMAPEQADPKVQADHRADVHGMAMTLLWALLGGSLPRGLFRNWNQTWDLIPIPHTLKAVLRKGTEEAPALRFQSVAALVEAMKAARFAPKGDVGTDVGGSQETGASASSMATRDRVALTGGRVADRWDVFVAYHRTERELALRLRAALDTRGVSAFVFEPDAGVGPWSAQTQAAQQTARLTVGLVSDAALTGPAAEWRRELDRIELVHPLLPVIVDPPAEDFARWPPAWREARAVDLPAVGFDAVVDRIAAALNQPRGPLGEVDDALRTAVADALAQAVPSTRGRRALLADAGVEAPAGPPWSETVSGLGARDLRALVELAREEDEATFAELAEALDALSPGDFRDPPEALRDAYGADLARAQAMLQAGDPRGADAVLATLAADIARVAPAADDPDLDRLRHRVLLNRVVALNEDFHLGEAGGLLAEIDPQLLDEPLRVTLARFLLGLGHRDRAEQAIAGLGDVASPVRALLAFDRGELVDLDTAEPDLLLRAAEREQAEGRSRAAADLALRAFDTGTLNALGWRAVGHVLGIALSVGWAGVQPPPADPARCLDVLRRVARRDPSWRAVRWLRLAAEAMDDDHDGEVGLVQSQAPWSGDVTATLADGGDLAALVARWPAPAVRFVVGAHHLARSRGDDALPHLGAAVAAAPGARQRLMLARCLHHLGRIDDAAHQLAAIPDDLDLPDAWDLRLSVADRKATQTGTGPLHALVEDYVQRHPDRPGPYVWRSRAHVLDGELQRARAAALDALDRLPAHADAVSLSAIQALGVPALMAPVDHALVARLVQAIDTHFADDPESEALRMQLLLASPDAGPPPDWDRLREAGVVQELSGDEVRAVIAERRAQHAEARALYREGALAFESWAEAVDARPGQVAAALQREPWPVPPPIPPDTPVEWRGRRCLVGALAVELFVALDLHDAVGGAATLVVFEDTWTWFANGAITVEEEAGRRESERLSQLEDALAGILNAETGADALEGPAVPGLLAWLGAEGHVSASGGPAWSPPDGPVVLGLGAAVGLHQADALGTFLDACRHAGTTVVLHPQLRSAARQRRQVLATQREAARIARDAWAWLTALRREERLEVIPLPPPPDLPPREADAALQEWLTRAFATREALARNPDLVAITAEQVELGAPGGGDSPWLIGRAWTRDAYRAWRTRCTAARERMVTVAEVVRALVPATKRLEALRRLARAGYVDAMAPEDLLMLRHPERGFAHPAATTRLDGLRAGLRTGEHALHGGAVGYLALHVGARVFGRALADTGWPAEGNPPDGFEDVLTDLLDAAGRLDRESGHRVRIVEHALRLVTARAIERWQALLAITDAGGALDPESPAFTVWGVLGRWAADDVGRVRALDAAVAATFTTLGFDLEGAMAKTVLSAVLTHLPSARIGAGGATWALVGARRPLHSLFDHIGAHERTLGTWVRAALGQLAAHAELDGFDLVTSVDGMEIRLDIAVAWADLPAASRNGLAEALWTDDYGLAAAMRAAAEDPAAEPALRRALATTPLRAVRQDPRVVLSWQAGAGFPDTVRTIARLRQVLGEPDDGAPGPDALVARAESGAWQGWSLDPMASQLAHIPTLQSPGPWSAEQLHRSLADLDNLHRQVGLLPAGLVGSLLQALHWLAVDRPTREVGGRALFLPTVIAELAVLALTPAGDDRVAQAHAEESALIRACGDIVDGLTGPPLSPSQHTWLSWRLYAWLRSQALSGSTTELLGAVADAAPPPTPPEACAGDLYDPARQAPERVDLREQAVLTTLGLLLRDGRDGRDDGSAEEAEPPESGSTPHSISRAVDWQALLPTLVRIATRPLTADERLLRDRWTTSSLGGVPWLAPDRARGLILLVHPDAIWDVSPEDRMRWLEDALHARPVSDELRQVHEITLGRLEAHPDRWSDPEHRRIAALLTGSTPPDVLRTTLLLGASGRDPALADAAWEAATAHLHDGPSIVAAAWFLAAARRGDLVDAAQRLALHAADHGIDVEAVLLGLGRPLLDDDPAVVAQARAVLRAVAATDRDLGPRLQELVDYSRGGDPS